MSDDSTRDEWLGRIEAYRKDTRKKKRGKIKVEDIARHLWDSSGPPLKFDNLIPRWQGAVLRYVVNVSSESSFEAAWNLVAPSNHSTWERLPSAWRASLEAVGEHIRDH